MAGYTSVDVILDSYIDVDENAKQAYAEVLHFNINPPGISNVKGYSFMFARIPFTYYVVNEFNNVFQLKEGLITYTCYLPIGTYNVATLPGAFQSAIMIGGSPNWASYAVFISELDLTFNVTSSTTAFSLVFLDEENQLANMLGFYKAVTLKQPIDSAFRDYYGSNGSLQPPANHVRAQEVVNLIGENMLRLSIENLNPTGYGSVTSSQSNYLNLALFPVNAQYGSMIEYKPEPTFVDINSTRPVQRIGIGLYFADGRTNGYQDLYGNTKYSNILSLRGSAFQVGIRLFLSQD